MEVCLDAEREMLVLPHQELLAGADAGIPAEHAVQLLAGLRQLRRRWSSYRDASAFQDEGDVGELFLFAVLDSDDRCSFCQCDAMAGGTYAIDLTYVSPQLERRVAVVYCAECVDVFIEALDGFVEANAGRLLSVSF